MHYQTCIRTTLFARDEDAETGEPIEERDANDGDFRKVGFVPAAEAGALIAGLESQRDAARAEAGLADARIRRVSQILIEEIGADGPESAETTAARAVDALRSARAALERVKEQWDVFADEREENANVRAECERLRADVDGATTERDALKVAIRDALATHAHVIEPGACTEAYCAAARAELAHRDTKPAPLPDGVPGEIWIPHDGHGLASYWYVTQGVRSSETYLHASLVAARVTEAVERCAKVAMSEACCTHDPCEGEECQAAHRIADRIRAEVKP